MRQRRPDPSTLTMEQIRRRRRTIEAQIKRLDAEDDALIAAWQKAFTADWERKEQLRKDKLQRPQR